MCFREDSLSGQHIVISGGCGAIGVGIVKKLTDHGANITVNDILEPATAELWLHDAEVNPVRMAYVKADLTQSAEVRMLVGTARSKFGPIHTALCHIGTVIPKPLLEYTADEWDETMVVNVRTAFMLGKTASQAMLEDNVAG